MSWKWSRKTSSNYCEQHSRSHIWLNFWTFVSRRFCDFIFFTCYCDLSWRFWRCILIGTILSALICLLRKFHAVDYILHWIEVGKWYYMLLWKVFPALREWCEERKFTLIDCDLRWGVPKDSTTRTTICTCMEELDRCHEDNENLPFFINILSERSVGHLNQVLWTNTVHLLCIFFI